MRLIGLSGKSGSGKDTVAGMIRGLTVPALRIGFADAVKEHAKSLGWNGEKDANGRVLLQYVGNREREADSMHWIGRASRRIDEVRGRIGERGIVVITDVRYRNEAEWVLRYPGELWRIERPGSGLTGTTANHVSEVELDDFPFETTIVNDGSLEALRDKVADRLRRS